MMAVTVPNNVTPDFVNNLHEENVHLPFIPECEVCYEGGPSLQTLNDECRKNPGHPTFIPVKDLTMDHLPVEWQTPEHMNKIQEWCERTVRISTRYTSHNRPSTYPDSVVPYPYSHLQGRTRVRRYGTGTISNSKQAVFLPLSVVSGKPCPCRLCKESGNPVMKYLKVSVDTATHVLYDDDEAQEAELECFFDAEDKEGVKCLYGLNVYTADNYDESGRYHADRCCVNCVTHDEELIQKLFTLIEKWDLTQDKFPPGPPCGFIISHPHGQSKHITIGNIFDYTFIKNDQYPNGVPLDDFGRGGECRLRPEPEVDDKILVEKYFASAEISSQMSVGTEVKNDDPQTSGNVIVLMPSSLDPTEPFPLVQNTLNESPPSEIALKPGVKYSLPTRFTVTVPSESKNFCTFRYRGSGDIWYTFPPGTQFSLPDGTNVCLPSGTEFSSIRVNNFIVENPVAYRKYSIDTCAGSSGAKVLTIFHRFYNVPGLTHAGALSGLNRCGLDWCYGLFT